MSEADQGAARPAARKSGGRGLRIVALLALLLVLVGGAGGAYYYMFLGHPAAGHDRPAVKPAALPFYFEIKPFVVSMASDTGSPHFVQIGVSLTLSGAAMGNLVGAVQPEVEDAMRQTVLSFKADDITTPAGVDKLRKAMTADVNRVLLRRLGPQRIKEANGGETKAVRDIYFTTLVIE
jgi:flagellar FliL protein